MTQIEKIKDEIERLKKRARIGKSIYDENAAAYCEACDDILDFIESLSKEQDVDIDKERRLGNYP